MSKLTLIAIEGRYKKLADRVDTLIEKENSKLPPEIQAGTVGSHLLNGADIIKGRYIGFVFAISLSYLEQLQAEGIDIQNSLVLGRKSK